MYQTNTDHAGSVIIDIEGGILEGKYLNEQGMIEDYFHIVKEVVNSVEVPQVASSFDYFPNPAKDVLTLKWKSNSIAEDAIIAFHTSDGKLLKEVVLGAASSGADGTTISLDGFAAGVYTLKLLVNKEHIESKLLIIQ